VNNISDIGITQHLTMKLNIVGMAVVSFFFLDGGAREEVEASDHVA